MSEPTRIGDILLRRELVDPHTLRRALAEQPTRGQRLVSMLITQTLIELDDGARALADQAKVPAVLEADFENRSAKLATVLAPEQARAWAVIPLSRDATGTLLVAARDPSPELAAAIAAIVGSPVKLAIGPAIYIERIIKSVYKGPAATTKPEFQKVASTRAATATGDDLAARTPTREVPEPAPPRTTTRDRAPVDPTRATVRAASEPVAPRESSGPHVIAREPSKPQRAARDTVNPNRRPTKEMLVPEIPPEAEPTPPPQPPPLPTPSPHVVVREPKPSPAPPPLQGDVNRRPTRQIPVSELTGLAEAAAADGGPKLEAPNGPDELDVVFDLIGPTPPAQAPVNEPPQPAGEPPIAIGRATPSAPIDAAWDDDESGAMAEPVVEERKTTDDSALIAAAMFSAKEHTNVGLPPTRAPALRAASAAENEVATPRTSTSAALADRPLISTATSLIDDQPAIIAAIDVAEPIPPSVTMPPPIRPEPAIARTRTPPPPPPKQPAKPIPGVVKKATPPAGVPIQPPPAPPPDPQTLSGSAANNVAITTGLTNPPPLSTPKKLTPPVGIPAVDPREKTLQPTESPFDEPPLEPVAANEPRPPTAPGAPAQPVAKEIERALSRATADRIVIKHLAERWKSALIVMIDGDTARPARAHGPKLTAIDRIVLAFASSSILRVTRDTATIAMATTRPNTTDQLLELIGVPATAAPVIVEKGTPVAIIAAGQPIIDLPTAIQDMLALAAALGAAYRRFR